MVSVHGISSGAEDLPTPMVIECTHEDGQRFLALAKNQKLYLSSPHASSRAGLINVPSNDSCNGTTEDTYFALPVPRLRPNLGYIFNCFQTDADFQIPEDAPKAASVTKFCIIVNRNLKWTLVDDSVTDVGLSDDKPHSAEDQKFLVGVGYHLSNPQSKMTFLANGEPNSIPTGSRDQHFTLSIQGQATEYNHRSHDTSVSHDQSTNSSPYPKQRPKSIAGSHKLATTKDIDAELLRQTGGDLKKGFYIDPARCVKAARLCQPLASRCEGGDADGGLESVEQGWTVLGGLDELDLQGGNEEVEGVKSSRK